MITVTVSNNLQSHFSYCKSSQVTRNSDKECSEKFEMEGSEVSSYHEDRCNQCLKRVNILINDDPCLRKIIFFSGLFHDSFLIRFVKVKKYDSDKAFQMIKDYISFRKKNTKLFGSLCPSNYKYVLDIGMHVVLKQRDPLGRKIFLFRTELWDPETISVDQLVAVTYLLLEEMVESEETQSNGIIFVGDQKGLAFKHFKQFGVSRVITILNILQGKFPLLCKGLHNINDPYWLQKLGMFAKPFFSAKLQKRVHFHGENYPAFHKFFPQEMLPSSLGGNLSWEEATDFQLYQRLYNREDYFRKLTALFAKSDEMTLII